MRNNTDCQTLLPETVVRFAEPHDLHALCELLVQLFSIEIDFTINYDKQYRGLSLLLEDPSRARIFVVEISGKIVAMCSLQIIISTAEGAPSAWLEDVIVDKDFRRQGLATLLLNEVSHWCEKNSISRLQLLADENNSLAQQFYQQQQWQRTQLHAWHKLLS